MRSFSFTASSSLLLFCLCGINNVGFSRLAFYRSPQGPTTQCLVLERDDGSVNVGEMARGEECRGRGSSYD